MTTQFTLETKHEDMIHDAQFDYYGRRLATCSSDHTIRIFDVENDHKTLVAELTGHEGPVWEVAWAHPKFGNVLASCSYDRRVRVWKESARNEWACVHEYKGDTGHELSINSISWAPHEFGLVLACGASDGYVSVLTHREGNRWDVVRFLAHQVGVNAVSWGPALSSASVLGAGAPAGLLASSASPLAPRRLVSAGSDNCVKVFTYHEADASWSCDDANTLAGHGDWVRDVAWAPAIGLPTHTIASCSQDGAVIVWTQDEHSAPGWSKRELPKFQGPVWRVSWSITGNILAVSSGDNKVTLWKESVDGEWTCLTSLDESSQ